MRHADNRPNPRRGNLTLLRRAGERIYLDTAGGIEIHVDRITERTVRLSIRAPGDVPIFREELATEEFLKRFRQEQEQDGDEPSRAA